MQDVGVAFAIGSVGVTNPGSCWVKFPQLPAMIPPRQYGVMIPAPVGGAGKTVRIDTTQVPSAAYVQDLSDLTPAVITFYEDVYPVSPGQSLSPFLLATGVSRAVAFPDIFPILYQVGSHTFDIPLQLTATGIIVFMTVVTGGSAAITISNIDAVVPGTGAGSVVLTSAVIAAPGVVDIRVHPGIITPVANRAIGDVICASVRLTLTVSVNPIRCLVEYLLIP